MATDKITEIVDQSAFDQVTKLKAEMKDLSLVFADLLKQAKPLKDSLGSIGGGNSGGVSKTAKDVGELEKVEKQLLATHEKLAVSETKLRQALEERKVTLAKVNQEIKENTKFSLANEGSVDQIRAKLGLLQRQYDALGKSSREAIGKDMLGNIQKLDTELKKIEASTGRYQRNVGNYTNATFQLTQVLRELPAFTYSAQTGLLGISNNLPMLADGFKQVSQATNETTGKVNGTIGALKIFGASIFSMGNIFTIAIGLFTIFSKEIFEFIKGTNKGTTATKDFSKALEDSSKSIGKELVELDKLYRAATNTNIAYKERKQAVDRLQELYPLYFKNIKDEIILAGEAKTAYEDLTKALINKAIVGAFDEQASELASKLPKLYKELDRLNKLKQEALSAAPPTTSTFSSGVPMGVQTAANSPLAGIDASIEKTTKDIEALKSAMDQLYKLASNFSAGIDIGGSSMGGGKSPRTKTVKDKQVKIDIYTEEEHRKTLKQIDEQILAWEKMTDKELDELARKYKAQYDFNQKAFQQEIDTIKSNMDGQERMWAREDQLNKEAFEKKMERLNAYNTIVQSSSYALSTIGGIISDKANAEADQAIKNIDRVEKAQLMSLSRITMGNKQYEEEKRRIEVQAEARRLETEKKRITAQRKAAAFQKAADVASIISGTANAIVAALGAKPYTPANLAFTAAAGVTGALQLTRALSAPLPQYADGTDYHPTDQPFLAGEAGAEGVILPSGKKMLVDRPTIFPAGLKGTKVISNKELMQNVYNTALVKLASQGTVTTNKMQEALIESLEEQAGKIDNVVKAVENLKLSVKFENFSDHISHVKQRTR